MVELDVFIQCNRQLTGYLPRYGKLISFARSGPFIPCLCGALHALFRKPAYLAGRVPGSDENRIVGTPLPTQ
jgi:hypothetical protein